MLISSVAKFQFLLNLQKNYFLLVYEVHNNINGTNKNRKNTLPKNRVKSIVCVE